MPTEINITVSEFQSILTQTPLPSDMRLTISFEDEGAAREFLRKRSAVEAMKSLRGTGNGNLVAALLRERNADESR